MAHKVTEYGAWKLKGNYSCHTANLTFESGHSGLVPIRGKTRAEAIKKAKAWVAENGEDYAFAKMQEFRSR